MPLYEKSTVQLPGGDTVEIRELSVEQLREADAVGTENVTKQMNMLPKGIIDAEIERQKAEGTTGEQEKKYEGHDQATLLRYGVTGWSFETEFSEKAVLVVRVYGGGVALGEVLVGPVWVMRHERGSALFPEGYEGWRLSLHDHIG